MKFNQMSKIKSLRSIENAYNTQNSFKTMTSLDYPDRVKQINSKMKKRISAGYHKNRWDMNVLYDT